MNWTVLNPYKDILTELQQIWEQVQISGKLHTVFIQGESGMYKSGLIRHFLDSSHATALVGYGSGIPEAYLPLRLAFESLTRIDQVQAQLTRPFEQVSSEWQIALTAWAKLVPVLSLSTQTEWEQLVQQLPTSRRATEGSEDEPSRLVTLPGLFAVALGELATLVPTVFFLDNLNLADTATVEALRFDIIPALGNSAVLLIAAFEPPADDASEFADLIKLIEGMPQAQSFCLSLIDEAQVKVVLQDELAGLPVPILTDLTSRIHRTTRGNLAQVQDIINWLKTLDIATINETLSIPEYGLLVQQHFEQLAMIEQQVLQIAAVQGFYFCREAVAIALEYATEDITDVLAQIEQKMETMTRFDTTVVLQDQPLHWHHFRPQHTQTWLYQTVPAEKKREYHGKTALALESIYGTENRLIAGLLARQFELGEMPVKAASYYAEIARQANDQGADQKALDYAQQGLNLLEEQDKQLLRGNLLLQKGRALIKSERAYLTQDIFRQALELTQLTSDPALEMQLLYYLGEVLLNGNNWDAGIDCIEKALNLAVEQEEWQIIVDGMENLRSRYSRQEPQAFLEMCDRLAMQIRQDPSSAAKTAMVEIIEDKAWLYHQKQRFAETLVTLQTATSLHSTDLPFCSPEIHYKLHRLYAQAFCGLHDYDQSLQEVERALSWAKASHSRANIARVHSTKATTLRHMGRIEEGEKEYQAALKLLHSTSDIFTLAEIESEYGLFLSLSGRKFLAKELYERSYRHRRQVNDLYGLQSTRNDLAAIDKHLGLFQSALDVYQQLYSESITQDDKSRQSLSLNHMGDIYRVLGRLDEAERTHRQAFQLCDELDYSSRKSITLRYLGRVCLCNWQLDQVRSNLDAAEAIGQENKVTTQNQRFYNRIYLGRLALCESRLADSRMWLNNAIDELHKLQDRIWVGIGYLNLGLLLLAEGQPTDSLSAAQSALEALRASESWRAPEAQHLLARCYLALGDFGHAEREIERAIINDKIKVTHLISNVIIEK